MPRNTHTKMWHAIAYGPFRIKEITKADTFLSGNFVL